jgi:hypothetical protein
LWKSIVSSVAGNATPQPLPPRATYGLIQASYMSQCFISERGVIAAGTANALIEIKTSQAPFDTALLHELDTNLSPTGKAVNKPLQSRAFDLAFWTAAGVKYLGVIEYVE